MTAPAGRFAASLAPLVLGAGLLAGCGAQGAETATDPSAAPSGAASPSPSPSPTPSASLAEQGPDCAEVWIDGARLPGGYDGCYQGGRRIRPDGRYCEFGKPLYTHDGRFWSVPGGRISEVRGVLRADPGYRDALAKCSA
jgi:hypothetical protein